MSTGKPLDSLDILGLPLSYLRQSDPCYFDPATFQRRNIEFDKRNGKPLLTALGSQPPKFYIDECVLVGDNYRVKWNDGHVSEFSCAWVKKELALLNSEFCNQRILWRGLSENDLRSSDDLSSTFLEVLTEAGMRHAIRALYLYGIFLVKNTPTADEGQAVAALGAALGGGLYKKRTSLLSHYKQGGHHINLENGTDGPLRTLYGNVWSTTSSFQSDGASIADSAYGHEALPLHTDMTYLRDPPGLQIFCMQQPAESGGESVFGDGFAAAEQLRQTNPRAFATLCQVPRRFHCIDQNTGWHLETRGPVISTLGKCVIAIRHNDLDRIPDLVAGAQKKDETDFHLRLQEAHAAWDAILAEDDTRLVVRMLSGDTVIVANQRCLHGRYSFQSPANAPRVVRGCYVSQDELNSRFRMDGYVVI